MLLTWQTRHSPAVTRSTPADSPGVCAEASDAADNPDIYAAEAPDAIEPADKGSITAFRYSENNTSAAVIYRGVPGTVVLGFPFETIISSDERDAFMRQVLNFLTKK